MGDHRLTISQLHAVDHAAFMARTVDESKAIAGRNGPMVIIAGSGMATGGRVLHHLSLYASDPRNTIALVGYQAPGTRGAAIEAHAPTIKLHGDYVRLRAEVSSITSLSAHADYRETLRWLANMTCPPLRTFVTHGEPAAADALRRRIVETLHWDCCVPEQGQTVELAEDPVRPFPCEPGEPASAIVTGAVP